MVPNITDPTYPTFCSIWDAQMARSEKDNDDIDRRIAIFGPLADLIHRKDKPMEIRCNCTMEFQRTSNYNHDDSCELWMERTFWDGEDYWDGEAGYLRIAPLGMNPSASHQYPYTADGKVISTTADISTYSSRSPWENADDYIWDGDTPIVSKATADARQSEPQVCDQEDEVNAALITGATPDEYGWVLLPDGSWADQENRVTYRAIKDDKGQDCWVEELWDEVDLSAPIGEGNSFCSCQPEKTYWCTPCGVTRDNKEDKWRWQSVKDVQDYENDWGAWSSNTCTHAMDPILLNGVEVYASKVRSHTTDTTPDLGIYAYSGWNPASPALFIPWQDYGLPTCSYTSAARSIKLAFEAAKDGQAVEVGCMGGHGRTGTILACMAILADSELTGPEAVKLVQAAHCVKAVETSSQEWFVRWFRAWHLGEVFTEKEVGTAWDKTPAKDVTSVPTLTTHGAVIHCTIAANGTMEEIYADGTIVTTFGGTPQADPKATEGGVSTDVPNGKWCQGCGRTVFSWHNTDCPVDTANWEPYRMPEQRDGNVAPGATANARRKADKRARRQEGAKRAKQKRADEYRNRVGSAH
jgi:hypothetical protein